jgi:hypothetical protein
MKAAKGPGVVATGSSNAVHHSTRQHSTWMKQQQVDAWHVTGVSTNFGLIMESCRPVQQLSCMHQDATAPMSV